MADLGYLRDQLHYWNVQVNDLRDETRRLRQRKVDVEDVKYFFKTTIDTNSNGINNKIISTCAIGSHAASGRFRVTSP
jgi:hypothetical protein